jgi:hypothetical protein
MNELDAITIKGQGNNGRTPWSQMNGLWFFQRDGYRVQGLGKDDEEPVPA